MPNSSVSTSPVYFLNMVVEGEEVQATVTATGPGADVVRIDSAKADGTPVLTGTASIGLDHSDTELAFRLDRALGKPPEKLVILDQMTVGQQGVRSDVISTGADVHYGDLYPFMLRQKLDSITEHVNWFDPEAGKQSPWGAAVVPIEMVSVLAGSGSANAGFVTRQPSV